MTPEDLHVLLARGSRAKTLLESEAFREAMRDLEAFHVAAMVACRPVPSEAETRDYHHTMLHSLNEIASQLAGYVEVAEQLATHAADEDDDL